MSYNDTMSDAVARLKNAQMAGHVYAVLPCSSLVKNFLKVLLAEGYISGFKEFEERKGIHGIRVDLKYMFISGNRVPVITEIKRVSKPGRRVYCSLAELTQAKVYNGLGVAVISTSQGVLTDFEARSKNIGGEILCTVY